MGEKLSKCQIQRKGIVRSVGNDFGVVEIEGRSSKVPIAKITARAGPGDVIKWTGTLWTV